MVLPVSVYALALSVLALLPARAAADTYTITKAYQGKTFFDDWAFYNNYDNLTNGDAFYVSSKTASKGKLAYVDSDSGQAIMRVDNSTTLKTFGQKRNSIRIGTKDAFAVGSVWVADMTHVPFGCSVWPAFWSSARVWPAGGEIDTFEAVNMMERQQMGLHTSAGCSWTNGTVQQSTLINATSCDINASANQGCVVTNPSPASYGAEFAAAGGGVWVTAYVPSGIAIWFFNRTTVPSSINANAETIDTSTLGLPVANFTNDGCNVADHFQAQALIFDIALCGDYAGDAQTFAQTCSGFCSQNYVLGNGSAYDDAYFAVNYVRVYGAADLATVVVGAGASGALPRATPALSLLGALALALGAWLL